MITNKIKAMFQFIAFLHTNINSFKQYDENMGELASLYRERVKLKPEDNFIDKQKYDKIEAEISVKSEIIKKNITQSIKHKARELNIYNFQNEPKYNWRNDVIKSDLDYLKEKFNTNDISEIITHKEKYYEYKKEIPYSYFLVYLFDNLDEILNELFGFFKEPTKKNDEPVTVIKKLKKILKELKKAEVFNPKITQNERDAHQGLIKVAKNLIKNIPNNLTVETKYFNDLPKTDSYNWIKQQGGQEIKTKDGSCFCFNIGLATILINDKLPVVINKEETTIKGSVYIDSFYNGFVEGKKYFIDDFKNNRYQSQDTIKATLEKFYCEEMIDKIYKGWKDFKDTAPRVLSYDVVKKYGYYNGVIFEMKKFLEVNEKVFSKSSTIIEPQPSNENNDTSTKPPSEEKKEKYNPSQFNDYTYNLFTYILDNYTAKGKVKYINIWYFLKRDIKDEKYKKNICISVITHNLLY